ncbi:MAG: TM7S3/TM198-like domain-containing protein [Chthoniobacterales bacterium]
MTNFSLPVITALIGVTVLFFGRKLFWLCVAALGFAAGVEVAPHLLHEPTPLLQLTIALALGFLGALLAIALQKVAVGILGFATGGRLAVALGASYILEHANYYWLLFLIGGVIGALLLLALFDWALIFLSSLIGAYLILDVITLSKTVAPFAFIGLTIVGVLAQSALFRRRRAVAA